MKKPIIPMPVAKARPTKKGPSMDEQMAAAKAITAAKKKAKSAAAGAAAKKKGKPLIAR